MTEVYVLIFGLCTVLYAAKAIDSDDYVDRFSNVVAAILWAMSTGLMIARL